MAEQDNTLFVLKPLEDEIFRLLSGNEESLSIAYSGPLLEKGRMEATLLGGGLRGYGRFVKRVAEMQLGILADGFYLEVQGEPQSGSLEVFVRFFHPLAASLRTVGDSKLLQGMAVLAALTGLSAKDVGKSLLYVFKKRKGRPFHTAEDMKDIPDDLPISNSDFVRLFNDIEVQALLRATLRPLRQEGIESFETRSNRSTIDSISKDDLFAADKAELDAVATDEEKTLDIEKVSFFQHLAWHLSDDGKPFDAKIEDDMFWKQISAGSRFGYGDRMRVNLHTEAEREASGRLRITRTVTKVLWIDRPGGQQIQLL